MPSADPARADYVQSPMHGVHTWSKVLVWTPETLRASQSERDTSVPCCLYLSEDSNAVDSISRGSGAPREIPGAAAICCRYSGNPVYCNLLQKAGRDTRSDPKRP